MSNSLTAEGLSAGTETTKKITKKRFDVSSSVSGFFHSDAVTVYKIFSVHTERANYRRKGMENIYKVSFVGGFVMQTKRQKEVESTKVKQNSKFCALTRKHRNVKNRNIVLILKE